MALKNAAALKDASPYNAAMTREQFLFYEVRTTARLMAEGLSRKDAIKQTAKELNLPKNVVYDAALQ